MTKLCDIDEEELCFVVLVTLDILDANATLKDAQDHFEDTLNMTCKGCPVYRQCAFIKSKALKGDKK